MIGRLNHVAIAVPDLDAASAQYRNTLGAKVGAPQDEPDHGVTVVFIELPNTKIELLYPLGESSPIAGFLEKNPAGGIHHICYEVDDILAARDRLKAEGARVLGSGEPKIGAHGETPVEMKQIDLALQWPDPTGTVVAEITLRPAGDPVQIEAEIGTFEAFLAGQVSSVGATVTAADTVLRFDGRANTAGAATGRMTGKSTDLARSLAVLGAAQGIEVPAVKTWLFGSDVTYTTDGRLALRDLTLEADANKLRGAADVTLGDVPKVTARLSGGQLDLSALLPSGDTDLPAAAAAGTGDDPVNDGWSRERMDFGWLAALNTEIALDVQGVETGSVRLGPSKLDLSLDNSRAVLKFQPATVFDGQLQGQVVVNNRNGLSVGGKLSFQNIRLEQALGQTMPLKG